VGSWEEGEEDKEDGDGTVEAEEVAELEVMLG